MDKEFERPQGGCTCGYVRYEVLSEPMIVHCCHCGHCQTQTGSAFVINALLEVDRIRLLQGEVERNKVSTPSGAGQTISRCPKCQVAIWSRYHVGSSATRFLRVGTLDDPNRFPPDVHIYTSAKQDWVVLPPDMPTAEIFYDYETTWSEASKRRLEAARAAAE